MVSRSLRRVSNDQVGHADLFAIVEERRALQSQNERGVEARKVCIMLFIAVAGVDARSVVVAQRIAGPAFHRAVHPS